MRQYLLPEKGKFYKANLHCHSNLCDGGLSPQEIKSHYQSMGYSIVAYTDHDLLIPHNDLTDSSFVALNGVELAVSEADSSLKGSERCFHLCCIALDPENHCTPCYHSTKYVCYGSSPYRPIAQRVPGTIDRNREYSTVCFNAMAQEARNAGFFVTYNHPEWSLEDQSEYCRYEGMHAMEIVNFRSQTKGFLDYNPEAYDAMLRKGKRLFCIGDDDNHNNPGTERSRKWDSGGAWVMIKSEKLEYRAITHALENGFFYTSQGPSIHTLWLENGTLHVECSPAEKIILTTASDYRDIVWAQQNETVQEADFQVMPEDIYVRITVKDHRGRPAETNAFFL